MTTVGCSSHPSMCLRRETLATAGEVLQERGSRGEVLCKRSAASSSSSARATSVSAPVSSVGERSSSSLCTCPGSPSTSTQDQASQVSRTSALGFPRISVAPLHSCTTSSSGTGRPSSLWQEVRRTVSHLLGGKLMREEVCSEEKALMARLSWVRLCTEGRG